MSLTSTPFGLQFPSFAMPMMPNGLTNWALVTQVLNASADKLAFIGQLYIQGEPGGTKTIDTTGSSSIGFRAGAVTFANVGSTAFDIGIQGVATGITPPAQPDGTFTVKKRMVQGTDTFSANAWNEKTPSTGTATLSHGQLIAVVFDFNTRAGADSIAIGMTGNSGASVFPTTNHFTAAAWGGAGRGNIPDVVLTFSDGTLGYIHNTVIGTTFTNQIWANGGTDEKGMIFQVPWDCAINALWTSMRLVDGTSDFNLSLYSTPEGTPSSIASVTVDAAQLGATAQEKLCAFPLAAAVNLTANTDYCVAVKATGAGNVRMATINLNSATHRAFLSGGTTLRGVSRAGSAAFSGSDTTLVWPQGVMVSQLNTTAAGVAKMAGDGGGFAG